MSNPPKEPLGGINLSDLPDVTIDVSRGETCFEFTCEAHRTLEFFDEAEASAMLEKILDELHRRRRIEVDDVRTFVRMRYSRHDAEWEALRDEKHRRKWKQFAGVPYQQSLLELVDASRTTVSEPPRTRPMGRGMADPTSVGCETRVGTPRQASRTSTSIQRSSAPTTSR